MAIEPFDVQLRRQLNWLEASCKLYDEGDNSEAIRIAVVIRTLFKDSPTSLLTHMGASDVPLRTSVPPASGEIVFSAGMLSTMRFANGAARWVPSFDLCDFRFISASAWWQERVYVGPTLTRRDIVLAAAEKDGGAHVDKKLNAGYDWVKQGGGGTFSFTEGGTETSGEVKEAHLSDLRQLGFELLNSPDLIAFAAPP